MNMICPLITNFSFGCHHLSDPNGNACAETFLKNQQKRFGDMHLHRNIAINK